MNCAFDPNPVGADRIELATQKEMHIEPGPGQHQAVVTANGAGTDDANTRTAGVHPDLL
ncbi:hypothetical protein D3C84_956220 [compost metagenome]